MITIEQYFGAKDHPFEHTSNATKLLIKVNRLLAIAQNDGGYHNWIDPDTGTQISGAKGGSGDGAYRLPNSKTGASSSSHKTGDGIDIYDNLRILAQWCVHNTDAMDKCGLWAEDFRWTNGWVHLQAKPPASGKRIYIPSSAPPSAPALEGQKPLPFIVK